jgi:hypothetical protein
VLGATLYAALNAELFLDILHTVKDIFKLTPMHHLITQGVNICLNEKERAPARGLFLFPAL